MERLETNANAEVDPRDMHHLDIILFNPKVYSHARSSKQPNFKSVMTMHDDPI